MITSSTARLSPRLALIEVTTTVFSARKTFSITGFVIGTERFRDQVALLRSLCMANW